MSYTIEKDIPLPEHRGRPNKYPFPDMDVGDSFAVPLDEVSSVRNAAYAWAFRHDWKLAVRKTDEGARCWRIA